MKKLTTTIKSDEYRQLLETKASLTNQLDKFSRIITTMTHEIELRDTVIEKYRDFFATHEAVGEVFKSWLEDEVKKNAEN